MELMNAATIKIDGKQIPISEFLATQGVEVSEGQTVESALREYWSSTVQPPVPFGVTSFEGLKSVRAAQEKAEVVRAVSEQFKLLVDNVIADETIMDKEAAIRNLVSELSNELSLTASQPAADVPDELEVEEEPPMEPATEIQYLEDAVAETSGLAEFEAGRVLDLAEAQGGEWDGNGPLRLEVVLIEPGAGNTRDKHWYPRTMLENCAPIFAGAKMFATDHRDSERNARTEVADIMRCPIRFTESGAPVAEVGIFDPAFARKAYNRHLQGTLSNLHVSIVGDGKSRKATINGEEYKVVEEIMKGSADFVSYAGAGGHAAGIAESEPVAEVEAAPAPIEETTMTKDEIEEYLTSLTGIPGAVVERLAEQAFETTDAIDAAAAAEVEYLKAASGSGNITANDEHAEAAKPERRTFQEHQAAMTELDARLGLV